MHEVLHRRTSAVDASPCAMAPRDLAGFAQVRRPRRRTRPHRQCEEVGLLQRPAKFRKGRLRSRRVRPRDPRNSSATIRAAGAKELRPSKFKSLRPVRRAPLRLPGRRQSGYATSPRLFQVPWRGLMQQAAVVPHHRIAGASDGDRCAAAGKRNPPAPVAAARTRRHRGREYVRMPPDDQRLLPVSGCTFTSGRNGTGHHGNHSRL